MSLISFLMSLGSMSHVDFKKWPCRPVEFKGQGSYNTQLAELLRLTAQPIENIQTRYLIKRVWH